MKHFKLVLPTAGKLTRYAGFDGSSDAFVLAELARSVPSARPLTIITANALDAQRLLDELPFFAPELKVHLLPDWETLPYDTFSPHFDLISERLATLYQVLNGACDVLIVPVTTALYRLLPKEFLAAHTFYQTGQYTRSGYISQPDDTGRLHARSTSAITRRIQRARWVGRFVSNGESATVSPGFAR